tara:strand:+ start:62 stop:265 length:204 start_codon:yes stop_codon:yes gene_type:complete
MKDDIKETCRDLLKLSQRFTSQIPEQIKRTEQALIVITDYEGENPNKILYESKTLLDEVVREELNVK